jgi:hypothetical protein
MPVSEHSKAWAAALTVTVYLKSASSHVRWRVSDLHRGREV